MEMAKTILCIYCSLLSHNSQIKVQEMEKSY